MEPVRPIFLLSLPRSGSTLLQRLLGAHEAIATASEPWFLLPLLYSLRQPGARAEYDHVTMVQGVEAFARDYLPGGVASYRARIRELALALYEAAAGGRPFFLDKTPRYGHVAAELAELFPEARLVFLWRNPLAAAASMSDTWAAGRWNLDTNPQDADLRLALPALIATYRTVADRAVAVRYEDLVQRPQHELARVLAYLELVPDPSLVDRFTELPTPNAFADPGGTARHGTITTASLDTWKTTMGTALRRRWCRRTLERIGPEALSMMGYDPLVLAAEVAALPRRPRGAAGDAAAMARGAVRRRLGVV